MTIRHCKIWTVCSTFG